MRQYDFPMTDAAANPSPMPVRFSLKQRVFRASAWAIGGFAGAQIMRLAGSLIMTRLLVPEMFGVMAIAFVFMTGLTMLSDVGLAQNIIQSQRGEDRAFLETAWSVQVLRSIGICAIALACAVTLHFSVTLMPPSSAYANPALPQVLAMLSLTAIITGFESNRLALARRNLEQSRLVRLDLVCTIVSFLFMVGWALVDRSIWALVAGAIASTSTRTLLSHSSFPGPSDRFGWDAASLTEIIKFGKWILLSSLLGFFVIQGDRILLGGLVDAQTLGIYSIAAMLAGALDLLINKLVSDVALPTLSEVARTRRNELRATFYRFHLLIGGAALFAAGVLLTSGSVWVDLLFDDRYRTAGWMLGIIAVTFATTPSRIATQCFLAVGESRPVGVLTLVRLPALYILTPLAFHWFGLVGALWAIAASAMTSVPIAWWFQARAQLLDVRREAMIWLALPFGGIVGFALSTIAARLA
jgi:O-antigen/teichoic acid export membrane protein